MSTATVGQGRRTTRGVEETERLGRELGESMLPSALVLLHGGMGTGKTVLTRGIAAALGVDSRQVQSPTFTLIHELDGARADLIHVDLYRLDEDEVAALGLEELLARPSVRVIEWAERLDPGTVAGLRARAFEPRWTVRLEERGPAERRIEWDVEGTEDGREESR